MHTAPGTAHDFEVFEVPITGHRIRTVQRDGEPWFAVVDVADALGYRDPDHGTWMLDRTERATVRMETPDGPHDVALVSESGLYRLVMGSLRPDAVGFQVWIARDVLPAIRRTGRYDPGPEHPMPQTYAQALRELASTVERAELAEASLTEVVPAAAAWRVLASADGDYSVREAAFILNRDPAIETGQGRLFRSLRELGVIDAGNIPYARHAAHVRLRATSYEHPRTGEVIVAEQVRLTAAGIRYLHRRLGGTGRPAFGDLLHEVRALPAAA
ncbi:MAG TPA: BRO family protein [Micromonosporaceae bacterium]|nr:BRO family protein [Micromonosporaceae bacterium]